MTKSKCRRRQQQTDRKRAMIMDALEERILLSTATTVTQAPLIIETAGLSSPVGYTPTQLRQAYSINPLNLTGAGQTIAIINWGNSDTSLQASTSATYDTSDLYEFDQYFHLLDPSSTPGLSFSIVTQTGAPTEGGSGEAILDVEYAHAMAPGANIVLVNAASGNWSDLLTAISYAVSLPGVDVVSMSFGSNDAATPNYDSSFVTSNGHQGITFLAATGDSGSPAWYPAASPNVVAVGGTDLTLDSNNNYLTETGWNDSGGGITTRAKPSYQAGISLSSTYRLAPDVSFEAGDGVAVYDSGGNGASTPWGDVGGTSVACPCWAGIIALADQYAENLGLGSLNGLTQTLPGLYNIPYSDFHDITAGNNGKLAGPGYDLVTGLGSPIADLLVPDLVAETYFPLSLSSVSPANGSQIISATGPTSFSFTFASAIDPSPSSINLSSFTVNGINPNSYSLSNGNTTVTFQYATSPVTSEGTQTITMAVGTVERASDDASGAPYSGTFTWVNQQLQVISTTPTNSASVGLPFTTATFNFNEAINPASAAASNLTLSQGTVSGVSVTNGNTSVVYTLSGVANGGPMTITLNAGALTDTYGVGGAAYTLSVTVMAMTVNSSTPASGAVVAGMTGPTSFSLTFPSAINPASVQLSGFTVNGITPTSFSLDGTQTVLTFNYSTSPCTTQGVQTMSLAADAVERSSDGLANSAYSSSFDWVIQQLAVSSSSPSTGSLVALPMTNLDLNFNEAINPANVAIGNLTLSQGTVTTVTMLNGNTTVRYTLSGITAGSLTATLPAGTITDIYGAGCAAYTATFTAGIHAARLSIANSSITRTTSGTVNMIFTVTRSGDMTAAFTVNYQTVNGTAVAGTDYVATSGLLNFAAGQTTATISVPIIGDNMFMASRTFSVKLSTNSTFASAATYSVGASPASVAVGDFNGDGKMDLAVVNSGDKDVSILLGNGNGTFASPVNYSVAAGANQIVAANFGNGSIDLAVACSTYIYVLKNQGSGTFTVADYSVSTGVSGLAVGDFNNDGKLDLVEASNSASSGSFGILYGNGNGTFQSVVNTSISSTYRAVAVGDFNGDNNADLVFTTFISDGVAIMLGNGNGTFQAPLTFNPTTATAISGGLVVTNLNGHADVVWGNNGGNSVSVLLGNGDGTFQPIATYGATDPFQVTVGDVNGDGKTDILTGSFLSNNVSVLLGNGDGTFQTQVIYPTVGQEPENVATVDLLGNGLADIVTTDKSTNNISVLLQETPAILTTSSATGTINSAPATTTSLTANGSTTSNATQPLSFTATVSGGVPNGETVNLEDTSNGNAVIASGLTSSGNGTVNFTVPANTLFAGAHVLEAVYPGDATYLGSTSNTVTQTVQVVVTSAVINSNLPALVSGSSSSQRSMVDSIVYTFSEAVNITGTSAFTISLHSGGVGGTLPTLALANISGTTAASTQWVVTFTGASVVGNSIANGQYDIALNSADVTSAANPSVTAQTRATDTFFRLYGDFNGDGRVNNTDYNAFVSTYGLRSNNANYLAALDYGGTGATISNADYNAFLFDYGDRWNVASDTI